jgi:hypothetical protein
MSTPEQHVDRRTSSPPPLALDESATQRQATLAGTRPVVPLRRRVVERLRDYPQLRERIEGYMLALEWRRITDDMRAHLKQTAAVSEDNFWNELWKLLTAEQFGSTFPAALGGQDEIRTHIECFNGRLEQARDAAEPAGNPYQAAERKQIASDVFTHVSRMWKASNSLAMVCKNDVKDLLDSLNSAVEEIFHDLEEAHEEEATATERAANGGFFERDDATFGIRQGSPSGRHGDDGVDVKGAGNQAATADVEAHRLWP